MVKLLNTCFLKRHSALPTLKHNVVSWNYFDVLLKISSNTLLRFLVLAAVNPKEMKITFVFDKARFAHRSLFSSPKV